LPPSTRGTPPAGPGGSLPLLGGRCLVGATRAPRRPVGPSPRSKPGKAGRQRAERWPRDVPRLGGPSCPRYVRRYGCARMPRCEESRVRTRVPLRKVIHREAVQVPSKRPRHQDKELEAVLEEAEERGWRVDKGKGYFRLRCPCGNHMRWVHLTPSGGNYVRDLLGWLRRSGCWKEGER